jgi:putative flippase GtrA
VRLVRFLPERWQSLAQELVTFGTVGVLNAIADFAVFNLLLPIGPLKANLVSTFVATSLSYLLNRHWTYRHRARTTMHREYVLFFAFNLVGFLIQSAVLGLAKYGLGFTEHDDRMAFNVAKAAGVGVAMVFRFWSYRTFVFKQHPTVATVDIAPEPASAPTPEPAAAAPVAAPEPVAPAAPRQVNGSRLDDDEFDQLTAPLEAELSAPDPVTSND